MNLTIPIRAENSNSSLRRYSGGKSADQKRFILSTVVISIVVSMLVISSAGSSVSFALAKSDAASTPADQQNSQKAIDTTQPSKISNTQGGADATTMAGSSTSPVVVSTTTPLANSTTPVPLTPAKTPLEPVTTTPTPTASDPLVTIVQPVTPVLAPVVTPPTVSSPPVATPVEVAPVTPPQPIETSTTSKTSTSVTSSSKVIQPATADIAQPSVSVDMASSIAAMAAVQAKTVSQPVTYPSARLSDEVRNRLIIMAAVAAITGGLLYTMSFIGTTPTNPRRDIPIRYIFPVKEAHNY